MGPLAGVRIVELGGIGPAPFASMLFAEMGADVLRISRRDKAGSSTKGYDKRHQLLNRGRGSVALDLKTPGAVALVRKLIVKSDALIEGFRPGVAERLGLGPEECLVSTRGSSMAASRDGVRTARWPPNRGHDINYIALDRRPARHREKDGPPVPPLNLVGDFGGGALYLAFGIVCAVYEAKVSGKGQVVDAAMIDGVSSLMTMMYGMHAAGRVDG
jgi:alpha-methylacyl-CoA racemase